MKPSEKNHCQSCGMAMHHLSDFGTNKDDTVNTEYCRFCFQKGVFTDHGITLEQKIEKKTNRTEKTGKSKEEATLAHSTFSKLKRRVVSIATDGRKGLFYFFCEVSEKSSLTMPNNLFWTSKYNFLIDFLFEFKPRYSCIKSFNLAKNTSSNLFFPA